MTILTKLISLEYAAADFGFQWETAEQIIEQARSELHEIEEILHDSNRERLQEEIGDLMHAVFSLCVFCQFDPNETLRNSVEKFERRFNEVKLLALKQGLNTLQGQNFDTLMEFWEKAKTRVG
jgi:uncharacterized protein YabN with tetrapyrrole methylase and pyrophosphatase domain